MSFFGVEEVEVETDASIEEREESFSSEHDEGRAEALKARFEPFQR